MARKIAFSHIQIEGRGRVKPDLNEKNLRFHPTDELSVTEWSPGSDAAQFQAQILGTCVAHGLADAWINLAARGQSKRACG